MFKESLSEEKLKEYNPLVFSFVGDAVHSLFVRTKIVANSMAKAGQLHKETSKIVCAKNQALLLDNIFEKLSEEEKRICLSARNSHTNNVPKNSDLETYKKSSAFEALIGYLYLSGKEQRLKEILEQLW